MNPERETARKRFLERAEAAGAPSTTILAGRAPKSSAVAVQTARRIIGRVRPTNERVARLALALDRLVEAERSRPRPTASDRSRRRQ